MNVIFIRSPYFIEVDEAGQIESKIELFIWNKETTEPVNPTYKLSKKAASYSQTKNIYNISNYVKEYIDIDYNSFIDGVYEESDKNWCYVKVKRYWKETTTFTLLDTTTYVALNGYTNYLDGYNNSSTDDFIPLITPVENITYKFFNNSIEYKPYINVYIDYTDNTDVYQVEFKTFDESYSSTYDILNGDTETQYLMKIPITELDSHYDDGNIMTILKNDEEIFTYTFTNECENKYTPIVCTFINRLGGWEYITFFKAKVESIDIKNKEYNLLPNNIDYDVHRGESKFFNYELKKSVKLNTGWVKETYNELIKDLMTSETILLDNELVKLKTMSTDLKTSLQDKMINYQIEFEYNFNQINNVI